jgi:hypothetical protein
MKKVAIALLLISSPALAGWSVIGQDDTGTSYTDSSAMIRNGTFRTMWSLLDYKSFQRMVEVGYFSQKAQAEYDCKEHRVRGLVLSLHAGHMGEGKTIYVDDTPHEWEAVDPGTLNERLWTAACR